VNGHGIGQAEPGGDDLGAGDVDVTKGNGNLDKIFEAREGCLCWSRRGGYRIKSWRSWTSVLGNGVSAIVAIVVVRQEFERAAIVERPSFAANDQIVSRVRIVHSPRKNRFVSSERTIDSGGSFGSIQRPHARISDRTLIVDIDRGINSRKSRASLKRNRAIGGRTEFEPERGLIGVGPVR